jgi:hypothetical protein
MDMGNTIVGPMEAERMARREQTKAMRQLYRDGRDWVTRRLDSGLHRSGAVHR